MKQLIILLLLCTTAKGLYAQAPGYLGKRGFLKINGAGGIVLGGPTASNRGFTYYGEKGGGLGFNTTFGLEAGYALSRRKALTLGVQRLLTGAIVSVQTEVIDNPGNYAVADAHELFYQISGFESAIGWQTYNPLKGALAPMGIFTRISLNAAFLDGKIADKRTTYAFEGATAHLPLGIQSKYTHWSAGLEVGQHTIFADRWLLSISAEFRVPVDIRRFSPNESEYYYDLPLNQAIYEKAVHRRVAQYQFFMLKIGGGLIF
jgi:hypothetical protein